MWLCSAPEQPAFTLRYGRPETPDELGQGANEAGGPFSAPWPAIRDRLPGEGASRRNLGRGTRRRAATSVVYSAGMNPFYKNLALWMVIGLIVILLFNLFQANQSPRGEIVFSDFLKKVDSGDVREVTLRGNSVTGRLSDGSTFKTFTTEYPDLVKALRDKGVRI